MKVILQASLAGQDFIHNRGDVVEYPDKEAIRLIEAGFAIPVREDSKKKEKAVK